MVDFQKFLMLLLWLLAPNNGNSRVRVRVFGGHEYISWLAGVG